MGTSNKKKRGKQRKVAKEHTTIAEVQEQHTSAGSASVNSNDLLTNLVVYTSKREAYIHPNYHELFALYFRRGDNKATEILTKLTSEDVPTQGISWPNISLDQSGILSSTLNFLKRCEDETFEAVTLNVVGVFSSKRLKSPSYWIRILRKALELEPSCRLKIANFIGNSNPLVSCMGKDTERLFFKSNVHWKESIMPFVHLISDMIISSTTKKTVDTLLKYGGLLASIIQWSFWTEEHRPDIVKELGPDVCSLVVSIGRKTIRILVTDAASSNISAKDKNLLDMIGTTPIVSKDYDPNCLISFVVGLIHDQKNRITLNSNITSVLQPLIEIGDCIDKDVIMEIIDLGMNHVHDYESAVVVARLSGFMLWKRPNNKPCDTRVAAAIRTGLLDMCLNLVDRFGGHESFCDENKSLYKHIESIFCIINDISLHQKTAKAIRSKKIVTKDKLVRLADTITENDIAANDMSTAIIYNDKCKDLLDMARSILNLGGSYCCRCNKSLRKTEVMQCNGCGRMSYCSRACQREDWLSGHKLTCNKLCTNDNMGLFQGRLQPETVALPDSVRASTKLIELEVNVNMIQLKMFLDHSETILRQAKELDVPLSDCIAVFKLHQCPLTVEVKRYTDWFNKPEQRGFEETRSKENITCAYSSVEFNGVFDEDSEYPVLQMQRFFPHEWLIKQTKSESVASID